ncbi:MAG: hypothetical protein ACD_39C01726G0001, partial [uncultured bacterium]
MSQIKQNSERLLPVAIVGKSALFPVALTPKAFWPNLLGLKGLMTGLATSQWPFSEFFSTQDLKNLKGFVMNSGLLTSGGLPADGFEIPPEILKISTVLPVVGLFLAKQALEDTRSFQKGGIRGDQVKVVLETRNDNASQPPSRQNIAELFASHFGFTTSPVNDSAPLPGTLAWLGTAVQELQAGTVDLV